ncbi:MAG: Wzz/FepE/Etk N-terminal domain-containing protein [Chitinispirillaceae bacterium]|jgi:hypothetical protein|nr:Wzz/FepE/Etk N-terminal domain-containing protein [Chitinispirillaceae bacterium]
MEQQHSPGDPDEINLLEYLYAIVRRKNLIVVLTMLGFVSGFFYAKVKGPTYIAEAIIAAKENDAQKTPSFSGLGAFGGLVASQLDLGGNTSLDRIEVILDSRKFNAEMIEKNDLLPFIYKYTVPKVYAAMYDTTTREWKPAFKRPRMLKIGGSIKSSYLKHEIVPKTKNMSIRVESKDSTFSDTLLAYYLNYLNLYIRTSVQGDAQENVRFLQNRLDSISDPLLREKIQTFIANEMEKEMLVSNSAFKIVDPPYSYRRFKEKKLYPLVFGFGIFFSTIIFIIFLQAIASGKRTDEDERILGRITAELRRII